MNKSKNKNIIKVQKVRHKLGKGKSRKKGKGKVVVDTILTEYTEENRLNITAIYKDNSHKEFEVDTLVGSTFRNHESRRPIRFIVPEGASKQDIDYLERYLRPQRKYGA